MTRLRKENVTPNITNICFDEKFLYVSTYLVSMPSRVAHGIKEQKTIVDQPIEICNTTRFGFVSICHMKKKANSKNDSGPHWNELGYILMGFLSTEVDILACLSIKI